MIEPINKYSPSYVPWLISAAVVALAFGGIGGSFQVSRIVCILIFPFFLARLLSFGTKIKCQNEILIFTLALIILSVMSFVWSIDKSATVQYLFVLMINTIPLLMIALLTPCEVRVLRKILPSAWLLAGLLVLPLAFYELLTGNHFALGFEERGGGQLINLLPFASGVHGNYNDFSLFLVLCVIGWCFTEDKVNINKRIQLLKYITVSLISIVVVINSSRAAILCLAAILVARFFFPIRKKHIITIGLLIVILTIIFISLVDDNSLLLTILQLKFTDFSSDFESDGGRLAIINAGLKGVFGSYGLGVGAGASSSYLAIGEVVLIPNPHNLLLEWALNFGFVGSFLLLWFLFRMWVAIKGDPESNSRRVSFMTIILLPLLGVIQSHLTGYTYFWLMLTTICTFAMWPRSHVKDCT